MLPERSYIRNLQEIKRTVKAKNQQTKLSRKHKEQKASKSNQSNKRRTEMLEIRGQTDFLRDQNVLSLQTYLSTLTFKDQKDITEK